MTDQNPTKITPSASDPLLIAFAGQAHSGKDTSALAVRHLFADHEIQFISFAGPLKAAIQQMFGIDMNDPYWIERKNVVIPWLGKSPRQLMQTLGTEWGRDQVHEDLWVMLCAREYWKAAAAGKSVIVLTDYRFVNEGKWLTHMGACIMHIERPGRALPMNSGHKSEDVMRKKIGEHSVLNDGTIADLHDNVKTIIVNRLCDRHGVE